MRRSLVSVSALALAVLTFTACSGQSDPESTGTDSESTNALCTAAAPEGDVADSISVESDFGTVPTVTFDTPLEVESSERTVAIEGDGPTMAEGDYVRYAIAVYDGATGEEIQQGGFDEESALAPISVTVGAGAELFFGCATEGSRIVTAVPPSDTGSSTGSTDSMVYVIDVLEVIPADQWCQLNEDYDGEFPGVEFDGDGAPTITVPDTEAPDGVVVEVLTEGDGDVVQSGDNVTVDYEGVAWSTGEVFDSSWDNGQSATFSTTGVVAGFARGLEGQPVGSTVLVSMSPECGYGEEGTSTSELAGETLVFVVEILETARP